MMPGTAGGHAAAQELEGVVSDLFERERAREAKGRESERERAREEKRQRVSEMRRRRRRTGLPRETEGKRNLHSHLLGRRALLAVGSRSDHRGLEQNALEDDALVGHVPKKKVSMRKSRRK